MTVISRPRNRYGFLFGTGADGDLTVSANTNLTSTLNGDIVYRNYMNLTIKSGCTLSVANPCKGLWIKVRGTLILNGTISMSNKGCYIAGGGSDLYVCYSDIKIPVVGAAGGTGVNAGSAIGNAGATGTDGRCGGGGAGGTSKLWNGVLGIGGNGASGFVGGGGCGGGGGALAIVANNNRANGEAGQPYGERGGNGASVSDYWSPDSNFGYGGGGAGGVAAGASGGGAATPGGVGAGGILIITANKIEGNGSLVSIGANGGNGNAWSTNPDRQGRGAGGGGGSGGGSITLMFLSSSANWSVNTSGGTGGAGSGGGRGGAGGSGSYRYWSMQQLASHTRL